MFDMDVTTLAFPFLEAIYDRLDSVAWVNPMINNPLLQALEEESRSVTLDNLNRWEESAYRVIGNAIDDAEDKRPKKLDGSQLPGLATKVRGCIDPNAPGDLVFLQRNLGFKIEDFRDVAEEYVRERGDKIYSLMSTWRANAFGGRIKKTRETESIAPILLGFEKAIIVRLGIDRNVLLESREMETTQIDMMFPPSGGEGNSSVRDPRRR